MDRGSKVCDRTSGTVVPGLFTAMLTAASYAPLTGINFCEFTHGRISLSTLFMSSSGHLQPSNPDSVVPFKNNCSWAIYHFHDRYQVIYLDLSNGYLAKKKGDCF
ncbi:MAG: hypothetical protein V7K48_11440 [Nostoc sp.]|uniref:hypothetical protein n=1 Tax=Nostoc sp. TaxID=1180 RepID=UPI002FFAC1C1